MLLISSFLVQPIQTEAVHIPPTKAFAKISTSNATVAAWNYTGWINLKGINLSIFGSNSTQQVMIKGPQTVHCPKNFGFTAYDAAPTLNFTCTFLNGTQSKGSQGTYNQTAANNRLINIGGTILNFINGTGNPVSIINSNNNNKVNITISSSPSSTSSSQNLNSTYKTSSYTVSKNDQVILINSTNSNSVITIPSISTVGTGKYYIIHKVDYSANVVEVLPTSAKLDTFNNMNLTNPNSVLMIVNNGTMWNTIIKPIIDSNSIPLKSGSNNWFGSWANQGTPTTLSLSNDTLYATPFVSSRPVSLNAIESEVTNKGKTSNCRMGIYTDNGNAYPSNLIIGSDTTFINASNLHVMTSNFTNNIKIPSGLYWLSLDCNDGSSPISSSILKDVLVNNYTGTSLSTMTNSLTVGNNLNRALLVVEHWSSQNSNLPNPTGALNPFNKIYEFNDTLQFGGTIAFFISLNPNTGNNKIIASCSASCGSQGDDVAVYSLYNVDQTTGFYNNNANGHGAASTTLTITPNSKNSFLAEGGIAGGTITSQNQQPSYNQIPPPAKMAVEGQYLNNLTNTNPVTFSFTASNGVNVAVEIKPATTSSGIMPFVRAIPTGSVYPILGMQNSMGAANGGTMYSVYYDIGSGTTRLPYVFPAGASISTIPIPEILVNVVG